MLKKKNNKVLFQEAGPDHPIYRSGFILSPAPSLKQYVALREQQEGLKNEFLVKLKPSQNRKSRLLQLIKILKKNGWRLKKDHD